MANETDTGLMGQRDPAEALVALAATPFDPATLLTSRPEAVPYRTGPTAEAVPMFDPATLLGDAARRGPAMIGDGKPLVARIGGVEVVTIPLEHYATLVSPLVLANARSTPNVDGMLELLTALRADGIITSGGMAKATGLGQDEIAQRVAAWKAAQPQPWTGEMHEDGIITGHTDKGVPFTMGRIPEGEPVEVAPEPAPLAIAPTPEEAVVDLGRPAGMPEETTIVIPTEPLDTRTTPPAPEKPTRHTFRRREKDEHRGGPMDAKGQPDSREVDIHDTVPHSTRRSTA